MKPRPHPMKRSLFLVIFCAFFVLGAGTQAQENHSLHPSWTLTDCFRLALKNSETLDISDEDIEKAESELAQTIGKALPQLSFQLSSIWQDRRVGSSGGLFSPGFTQGYTQDRGFRLKLPFLTGYRELAAIRGGKSLIAQKEEEKKRLAVLLFNDVASAYFAVVLAEENLKTTKKILALTKARHKELEARVQLGRSRKAELLDTEADIAVLEFQQEEGQHNIKTSRSLLTFLVGSPIEGPLEATLNAKSPLSLETYLLGLEQHPEILAKQQAVMVAKQAVEIARADHFPGFEVTGNYYTKRIGVRKGVDWDVSLGVSVPLWSWGTIRQGVLAAESALRQTEQTLHLARREKERAVTDAYENVLYAFKKVKLQEKVLRLVDQSYRANVSDYRQGLVTNFEVLDTLKRLRTAEQASTEARFQNVLAGFTLDTAAGKIPGENP